MAHASPTGLVATAAAGNTVTIAWTPPTVGVIRPAYLLEGGINPGEVLASIPTGSVAPTFTFVAPTGAFYIRVHAVAGTVRSAPSNEIRIFVNVPAAPSAPADLLGLVNGTDVALSWTNTFGGGVPTSLWLSVGGAVTTVLPLPMGDTFNYAGVPPGTYTLSVVAANASDVAILPGSRHQPAGTRARRRCGHARHIETAQLRHPTRVAPLLLLNRSSLHSAGPRSTTSPGARG